jgi:hypothetical protein
VDNLKFSSSRKALTVEGGSLSNDAGDGFLHGRYLASFTERSASERLVMMEQMSESFRHFLAVPSLSQQKQRYKHYDSQPGTKRL